jgi:hypothetical protein
VKTPFFLIRISTMLRELNSDPRVIPMINANELTKQTTNSPSDNTKLTILACALGLVIFVVLYVKTIGF